MADAAWSSRGTRADRIAYMRVRLIVLLSLTAAGGLTSSPLANRANAIVAMKTEVVSWSPFNSASEIKPGLTVKAFDQGECPAADSEEIGFAYRCTSGNLLFDPCWPDGSNPTEFAICAADPWSRRVYRIHDPQLLLRAGVPFGKVVHDPWGIVLEDGNRCLLAHGAHNVAPTPKGRLVVDYYCRNGGISLLRDLQRGRVWKISAVHLAGLHYTFLGDVAIRRAYLGGLPPAMRRENAIARSAIAPARRAAAREHPKVLRGNRRYVDRVRLSLPDGMWARVGFFNFSAAKGVSVVLHFVTGRWVQTVDSEPYCQKLPPDVRPQLFTSRECPAG
jgi:hypothetical protein